MSTPTDTQKQFAGLANTPALAELKAKNQWVAWNYVERKGRLTKPPLDAKTGRGASHSDPATWSTYDQAADFAIEHGLPGVGFVLSDTDDFTGIDLDKCIDQEGNLAPWAEYLLLISETYAEVSPSGRGLRLIARGKVDKSIKCDPAGVEIYRNLRYLTITGRQHPDAPDSIAPAPVTLAALAERVASVRPETAALPKSEKSERTDFIGRANHVALAHLSKWVPEIFPRATFHLSTGAFRVSSDDLGRGLEEDLSIAPNGIKDFGLHDLGDDPREGRRTAIALVIEHGDLGDGATETDAAFWLCDRLGVSPEQIGWVSAAEEFGEVPSAYPTLALQAQFDSKVAEQEAGALAALEAALSPTQRESGSVKLTAAQRDAIAEQVARDLQQIAAESAKRTLSWVNIARWDTLPVPEREWAVRDRVPLRQVGVFSGEGGTGKSILELQKNIAHVAATDWLGTLPERGAAIYIGCEDEEDEIHRRVAAIAAHYGQTFGQLAAGGLHVLPLLGLDATLCAVNTRSGRVETTGLYRRLFEAAGDIKPKNISIDTLSRAFAGNEIDRVQVYAFAQHMQALAKVANGSVTVLSHPSLHGMASGSGLSGSTAWHGAFRFRQYLTAPKAESGEQPDSDLRELQFKKNQYGPRGDSIVLRYQNGLFLPETTSSFDAVEREKVADDVFLELLRRFRAQGRHISEKSGTTYAPATFAKEGEAQEQWLTKKDLEAAMRRLFTARKIRVEISGPPSRRRSYLVIAEPVGGST